MLDRWRSQPRHFDPRTLCTEKVPGSLPAVIVGILMVKFLPLKVATIGNLYTISNSLPTLHIPSMNLSMIGDALPNAFTIAVLAAIESLLSCVVADGMINGKHRSDMELVAQGAGNIASALFGGIPATGAIARTAQISKTEDVPRLPESSTPSHWSSCLLF